MRVPFFHYTCLDNLLRILGATRIMARYWLEKNGTKITDISIDPEQPVRKKRKLLEHVPLFPGFYTLYRGYALNGYLMKYYDDPKVQNKSFYGTLNKTLQVKMGTEYENVTILLVSDGLIYKFADQGKVRFFSDIAVKPKAEEFPITCRTDLQERLKKSIDDSNIQGEIDLFDDGKTSISCPSDIEAIIVDNAQIARGVRTALSGCNVSGQRPQIFVSQLPRSKTGEDEVDS